MLSMPKLVQRWLYWSRKGRCESPWLEIVEEGQRGRETVIDYASLVAAYERYKKGDRPPPMPCEVRSKTGRDKGITDSTETPTRRCLP